MQVIIRRAPRVRRTGPTVVEMPFETFVHAIKDEAGILYLVSTAPDDMVIMGSALT